MGRQPGFTETRYPVPDAYESVGAAHNIVAHDEAERGNRRLAIIHTRIARSYWELSQEERKRMRQEPTPITKNAAPVSPEAA